MIHVFKLDGFSILFLCDVFLNILRLIIVYQNKTASLYLNINNIHKVCPFMHLFNRSALAAMHHRHLLITEVIKCLRSQRLITFMW